MIVRKTNTNSHIDLEELEKEKMMTMIVYKDLIDKGDLLTFLMIKINKMIRSIINHIEQREYLKKKMMESKALIEQKELKIFLTQRMKMMKKITKCLIGPKE